MAALIGMLAIPTLAGGANEKTTHGAVVMDSDLDGDIGTAISISPTPSTGTERALVWIFGGTEDVRDLHAEAMLDAGLPDHSGVAPSGDLPGVRQGTDGGGGYARDVAAPTSSGSLLGQYDWPIDEAFAVMMCESGGDSSAVSADGQNIGMFQINLIHGYFPGEAENVAEAYRIWKDQGWDPWACHP